MKRYTPAAVGIWRAKGAKCQALLDTTDDITLVQALDLIEKGGRIKSLTVPRTANGLALLTTRAIQGVRPPTNGYEALKVKLP